MTRVSRKHFALEFNENKWIMIAHNEYNIWVKFHWSAIPAIAVHYQIALCMH